KEITAESDEFEATDAAMVITMTFTVNAEVAGKTVVVYEDLWHNDVIVAYHHDIEDEDQSVHYPEIGTVAVADDTEDHVTKAKETVRITDTVRYENLLTDGRTYVMRGVLMDKETQKAILLDGKEITAETKFVPEKETGEVEIVFEFDGTGFAGTTLVAFEKCYILKGVIEGSAANPENPEEELVAVHEDIDDEDQTVYLPEIKTTLLDQATEIDHSMADTTVTLIDTVFYKDLLPGKEYTVKGILMNKATGKEVLQDGKKIEESTTFKAEKSEGSVEVVFTFSSSVIKTDPVVAFEKLLYKEIEVAAHEDLTDADQTDYIPEISTTAKDSETEEHIALADEEVTIIDTVDYQGLKPDTRYVVKGVLMDKETGKELLDANGKQITSDVSFVTGKCKEGEASISGSIDLTFKFDGSVLAGKTAVAFERLYQSDKEVAVHTDIEDEEQTIHFPEGRTTATDKATENHTAHLDEKVTIEDEVFYKNLIPGKEYTVKGTLMIKETEKPLLDKDGKEITVTKTFKAEKPDGSILIVFENIDTTNLVGKSIVAFEQVDYEGEPVIVHADLEDEDQTVVVPEIKTTATDKTSGTKDMTRRGTVLLIDVVEYHGLTPGEEYTVKGEVYDKETGESIEVTAELTFVPDETDGSVELVFEIDTDAHHGHHLVVFEKVYDSKGNLIADHSDLEDEDQTVNVPEITGSVTGEYPRNPVPRDQLVITGDTFNAKTASALMLASGISSLLLIGIVLILKKRRRAAGMLLAILLLCGSMFAFGIKAYAATDETTVEETGVIRGEDGEFYYEFAPEIEKDGVKYELSDVSYEPDPLEKLKTDQTDEYLTSDNFSPPEQIEQDGIPYVLDHVEKTERVETARSVPYEESVERDDMVEIRQDELNVKVTDPITEEDVVGTVPFAESKVLSGQWMPDMQTDLIFSDYNGDYFDIAGVSYPKNKETPLPADSYPSVLTNVLKLPADRYRITSIVWNGEEYENDQGIFRNARIYGDSYHQMVKDTFRGDVALPDLSYTEYKCFYVESDEHLRARETATAIAVYKAVPEETTEETTTETPETELTKPAEPEVVNKTIFQQPVFYISIISVLVIAGVVIFLAGLSKKKKKENQNK
ncbi:MAG: VaFE repeat-containing surface-anchored protein, partial [Erysipelotrichaceae bacterium]|nr:VaFE repeat-containing surface-anchored protein [Erysipelotrichaceae bacterium]